MAIIGYNYVGNWDNPRSLLSVVSQILSRVEECYRQCYRQGNQICMQWIQITEKPQACNYLLNYLLYLIVMTVMIIWNSYSFSNINLFVPNFYWVYPSVWLLLTVHIVTVSTIFLKKNLKVSVYLRSIYCRRREVQSEVQSYGHSRLPPYVYYIATV